MVEKGQACSHNNLQLLSSNFPENPLRGKPMLSMRKLCVHSELLGSRVTTGETAKKHRLSPLLTSAVASQTGRPLKRLQLEMEPH